MNGAEIAKKAAPWVATFLAGLAAGVWVHMKLMPPAPPANTGGQ